jgi:hypothetical protein
MKKVAARYAVAEVDLFVSVKSKHDVFLTTKARSSDNACHIYFYARASAAVASGEPWKANQWQVAGVPFLAGEQSTLPLSGSGSRSHRILILVD